MWIKKHWSTVFLLIILLIGAGLVGYPTFADWWNNFHQARAITNYAEQVSQIDDVDYQKMIRDARAYNKELLKKGDSRFNMTDEEREEYNSLLSIDDSGIMGVVEIPKINVSLPIYHGTSEEVLQIAIGHIEGSSLPVGGEGTHCVISGHRGLPSAKIFTDLDQLQEGDIVQITVLDETLTYEIDQIRIVLPNELEELAIDPKKDYLTLVTCTPYGINSHRMLVRGHRIDNPDAGEVRVTSDATQIEPLHVVPVVIGIIAVLLIIFMMISSHRRRQNIRAYRNLTLERHEKEKAFDMEYYYTRHPDRRPKEDAPAGAKNTSTGAGRGKGRGRKRTSSGGRKQSP